MIIAKEFSFDSAHRLSNYDGPCANLHGHTYKLQVVMKGEVKPNGMVVDFAFVKKVVKEHVISRLDHTFLNELIEQPTAENIATWMWNTLKDYLPLYEIRLWETPTSFVIYTGE